MNAYAIHPLNPFGMRTYAMGRLVKALWNEHLRKMGWGVGEGRVGVRRVRGGPPASCEDLREIAVVPVIRKLARAFPARLPRPDFTLDVDSRAKLPLLVRAS